jgi:Restriction endonuclease
VKRCPKCGVEKPREAFSKSKKYTDGLAWCCRECVKAYSHSHYERNKAKMLAQAAEYRRAHPEVQRKASAKWHAKNPNYTRDWQRANPEKRRAISKRWHERHPDKVAKRSAAFKARRPTYFADYYQAHKERHAENGRRSYEAHIEERRERHRQWHRDNPMKTAAMWRRRRYRLHAVSCGPIDLQAIWERDKGICHLCKEPVDRKDLNFDHIIPVSKGGKHSQENLAVSHERCNKRKGRKILI